MLRQFEFTCGDRESPNVDMPERKSMFVILDDAEDPEDQIFDLVRHFNFPFLTEEDLYRAVTDPDEDCGGALLFIYDVGEEGRDLVATLTPLDPFPEAPDRRQLTFEELL